ncbi:unnamed protein product [Gadus morhua 'NCC']
MLVGSALVTTNTPRCFAFNLPTPSPLKPPHRPAGHGVDSQPGHRVQVSKQVKVAVLSSLSLHPSSLPLISSLFLYGVSCLTPTLSRSLSSGSHYLNLPTTPSIVTFPLISVTVTAATVAGPGIAVTR